MHWQRHCCIRLRAVRQTRWVIDGRSSLSAAPPGSRFPREVIPVAVRWYLRYGLASAMARSYSQSAASTSAT